MGKTLATMLTATTYGTWLPGDGRGWVSDGITLPPQPRLEHYCREKMAWDPFLFPREQRMSIGQFIGSAASDIQLLIHALAVTHWHIHVVVGPMQSAVGLVVKHLKSRVRGGLGLRRPIWGAGYDKRWCFTVEQVLTRIEYVRRHNLEDGLPPDPWDFIVPFKPPR